MVWFDYVMIVLPGLLLTLWARVRIAKAYAQGSRVAAGSNLKGEEAARLILRAAGVTDVVIQPATGELSNYYDPRSQSLRLSGEIHEGYSLTAISIAALESGHAIQHAEGYLGLAYRRAVVPVAELGSQVCAILLAGGFLLGMFRLVVLGMTLFLLIVVLQIVNLPVELDAGRRSRQILIEDGLVMPEEEAIVTRAQVAACWTYVARCLTGSLALFPVPRILRAATKYHACTGESK